MHRGYVKLWRKSIDAGWLQNPKLWTFWSWCLMKASHKEHKVIIGNQEITLKPGQFIFGRNQAAKELKMNPSQIYRLSMFLKNSQNLDIKANNKFSVFSIMNWTIYQSGESENEHQNEHQTNIKRTQTRMLKNGKKSPGEISNQISFLGQRYSKELLDRGFRALASTRKGNKISESVKLSILQKWNKYPVSQVESAIRTYLEKDYAAEGKGEAYLSGIIRNNGNLQERESTGGQVMKSTGSALLDDHYRSQGIRII